MFKYLQETKLMKVERTSLADQVREILIIRIIDGK